MKKRFKILSILMSLALAATVMASCTKTTENAQSTGAASTTASENAVAVTTVADTGSDEEMFTSRDREYGYDESTASKIEISSSGITCSDSSVSVSGTSAVIKSEGTYIISGSASDAQITVDASDTDKIQIVLSGISLTDLSSAAIYVKNADKVLITLAPGSVNTFTHSGDFAQIDDNNIDGVIFAKSDITINGTGTLTIKEETAHGIVCKDDLKITGGTLNITAAKKAIDANDSVRIADGTLNLKAGTDAVHVENTDDTTKGFFYIEGGVINAESGEGDCIDASYYAIIKDGTFSLKTGSGASSVINNSGGNFFTPSTATTDSASLKGIKANGDIAISGGKISIDSEDDAIHSNTNVTISGGELQIATGDDGVHADTSLTVSGGNITVSKSYEGLEGTYIEISGGTIDLTASDDGINAAGGADGSGMNAFGGMQGGGDSFSSTSDSYLKISGGNVTVNCSGDGLDSNNLLEISGGYTVVYGPTNDGNGAIDYERTATITGGTLIAIGSSGMAMNMGSSSTQGSILVNANGNAGDTISLSDSSGKEIISVTAQKQYASVLISDPSITTGNSYTLKTGSSSQTIEMTSLIYGQSGGMGGGMMGGMQQGGMGGPGGNMQGGMGAGRA